MDEIRAAPAPPQFASKTAGDCAIHEVVTVEPTATLRHVAELMRQHRINALPVVAEGSRLLGMVGIRDVLRAPWPSGLKGGSGGVQALERAASALDTTRVSQVMARRLVTAQADTPIAQVLADMVNKGVHPIPIVEEGRLVGLVSRNDIVVLLLGSGT